VKGFIKRITGFLSGFDRRSERPCKESGVHGTPLISSDVEKHSKPAAASLGDANSVFSVFVVLRQKRLQVFQGRQ
jgi:hypothetical protein